VVCLDTLEHVFRVNDAFDEMFRILRPGGLLIAATTMRFPIHHYPDDYWRMTPQCLQRLTEPFAFRVIGSQGTETFPHTVFAVAVKGPSTPDADQRAAGMIAAYDGWLRKARASASASQKANRFVKSLYRSKGERRELVSEFTARFQVVR
jgi:hypothetical protein